MSRLCKLWWQKNPAVWGQVKEAGYGKGKGVVVVCGGGRQWCGEGWGWWWCVAWGRVGSRQVCAGQGGGGR